MPRGYDFLVAEVVGYSRLAGADEDRTLSRLRGLWIRGLWSDLVDPAIDAHHGRVVNSATKNMGRPRVWNKLTTPSKF